MKKVLSKMLLVTFSLTLLLSASQRKVNAANVSYEEALNQTVNQYVSKYEKGFSENIIWDSWVIVGLARSEKEVPKSIFQGYYTRVEAYVQEAVANDRRISGGDLAKLILSLNAIGEDPTNVAGVNLVEILWNEEGVLNEYYTSLAYILIALDSKNYEEPANAINTREKIIKKLLSNELPNGGFGWENVEGDSTSIVLQALVNHKDNKEALDAVQRAESILSNIQLPSGGYEAWGSENSSSAAQVIVYLTENGVNPLTNTPFIKGENNLVTNLMSFYQGKGIFGFTYNDSSTNWLATEQAFYSLVSMDRFTKGKTSLYDMRDVVSTTDYLDRVKEVNILISKLPEVMEVSLDHKALINGALGKYNSLPKEYKDKVENAEKLNTVSIKLREIQGLIDGINSDIWNKINPENITLEDKIIIEDLIRRYENLNEEDRKYIVGYEEVLTARDMITSLEGSISKPVDTGDGNNFARIFVIITLSMGIIFRFKRERKEA